ncbi:MAG: ABC transporter substrate-binding protein [Alphaproteobacteria bacterium]|nr:ABC transporter substrate-binding protein [Alphaproteobacteria bacterium]
MGEDKMSKIERHVLANRRTVIKGLGAGALALAAPAILRSAHAQSKEVVYATWGGSWEDAIRKVWFEPFTQQTGIRVKTIQGPDYGKIRAMVRAGKTEWDVVEVNPDFQWTGPREGLLEKLDYSIIDTTELAKEEDFKTEYSVAEGLWSRVICYNTKKFPTGSHPKNFVDFWDLKKFPGKRVMYTKANGGILEAALLADGVHRDKLYPLDVDRALKSQDKIKEHVLWYDTNAQAVQYMQDEQGVMGLMADGRVQFIKDKGAPVEIEFQDSQLTWTSFVVPKSPPNKENAMRLINHMISVESQRLIGLEFTYGLVTPKAYDLLPPGRADKLTNGPAQKGKAIVMNEKWWGENQPAVQDKLNAWRIL